MTALTLPRIEVRRPGQAPLVAAILVGWTVLGLLLAGRDTLPLGRAELTGLHRWLNDVRDAVGAARAGDSPLLAVVDAIRLGVGGLTTSLQDLIAQPAFGRPVPVIGWLGVVALVTLIAAAVGTLRVAVLAAAGFTALGLQGLWQESMDTLALTLAAVLLSLLLGIPLGIAAGLSDRVHRPVTVVLDLMQTMPTVVYLAPLTLFFLIGPASATIATTVYAMPPAVRYTAHAIRGVPASTREAAVSLGATGRQQLTGVLLPVSRPTIVLGINQTLMAALSMATVAALIDAPGLGITVLRALQTLDVGTAFNAGLAIVVIAVVLDRTTTAASRRARAVAARTPARTRRRRLLLLAGAAATAWCVYLSRTYVWAAEFPGTGAAGRGIARGVDAATAWVTTHLDGLTGGLKDGVTLVLIDPLQALLTGSPWWLVTAAVVGLAAVLGSRGAAAVALACLVLVAGTGLWQDAMATLAATLVATMVVVAVGVAVGVWMGRSTRADAAIRPVLDAAQTMPPFVYLVPFLALFAASRFTAIAAAVVYAAPVTVKVVADGIRGVPVASVEAATVAGSTAWQTITKVQLPLARHSLTLATNQGLCYVLSMVVVGGLVGAGALGYDVVAGFSQRELYGKGLAAGAAIVLLGILLDRITRASLDARHRAVPDPEG